MTLATTAIRRLVPSARLVRFATVGGTGFVVNTATLAVGVGRLGVHYLIAAVVATVLSTGSNFVLTEHWVFADRRRDRSAAQTLRRFATFLSLSLVALLIRGPLLVLLTEVASLHYLLSNTLSLLALMVLRYRFAGAFIWPEDSP